MRKALKSQRQNLLIIQNHFRQLQEFYPRYHSIMSRSDLLDFAIGFAAGFLGGGLGVTGAKLWEDWREKGDKDFTETFAKAIDSFLESADGFSQKTEEAVEAVANELCEEMACAHAELCTALAEMAKYQNLTPIYRALHFPKEGGRLEDDAREFFEVVLNNLSENGLNQQSRINLEEMLGMLN
jgi:hypothetical protein